MTEDLKPCPFCGSPAQTQRNKTVMVSCTSCTATTFQRLKDKESAVRTWNTRAESGEVVRLKAKMKRWRALVMRGGEYAEAYIMHCDTNDGISGAERYLTELMRLQEES
jgi:Lar family restriction alleviation protein